MTVLHHKIAIVLRPQICDVNSPYRYQLQQFYLMYTVTHLPQTQQMVRTASMAKQALRQCGKVSKNVFNNKC